MATALHVYVAGSSREIPRVREAIRMLVRGGCTISGDWVSQVEQHGSAGARLDDLQRASCAQHDLDAIDRADAILVLWPRTESVGAYVELGYALAATRLTIAERRDDDRPFFVAVAGGPNGGTIWHSFVRQDTDGDTFDLDADAVAWLVARSKEHR